MLLFLVMMLSTLPMTAIGSVIAGALGLAGTPGAAGPRIMIVLLLVFLGMLYVIARFGFIFPAVAVEENYSLRLARSEEHTSELQSLMRISYAVFCLKKKKHHTPHPPIAPSHDHPPRP